MDLSCSPPLSVNYSLSLGPYSCNESGHRCRKFVSFCPKFAPTSSSSVSPSNVCSTSSSSSYFGISVSRNSGTCSFPRKRVMKPSFSVVSGMFERFTERAIRAVMFSQREAKALGRDMVYNHHLLLGLIAEDHAPDGFLGSGVNIDIARETVQSLWEEEKISQIFQHTETSATDVPFSSKTKLVFEAAVEYSKNLGYNFIAPEHIAIGLLTVDDGTATLVLQRLGVNVNYLVDVAISRLEGELAKDGRELSSSRSKRSRKILQREKATSLATSPVNENEKKAIDRFCVDLTARAMAGAIDPVIGRDNEIKRIIQILARKTKSNPILLGEAGVGKTAIAEGLALSITDENIPNFLAKKRVLSLDIGLLIAGAKERGELEERVTLLLQEIKNSGNIILFIDEVHTLIGSGTAARGSKGSGIDIANLLKPSLGRGEFQCIASTTLDEFRLHFEKDKALARRFQPVLIKEPSQDDAIQILLGLREKYESYHGCVYTLEAINAAVNLSARYIQDRHLPDKAIDLIDEAGSKANIEAYKKRKEARDSILSKSPSDYWHEIKARHQESLAKKLSENGNFSKLEEARNRNVDQILESKCSIESRIVTVGLEDVASVASLWSGIPVNNITVDERKLLVDLNEKLKKQVIGQDEAVDAICRAMKRSRVGLKDPERPIAAMLFCGPTGVGKTELTKCLASTYFGSETAMLRLDMSEYMESHSVSKLIGAPPGYIGYEGGGILTEAIRRQPFSVVLLDEIEKAHPHIFNILLQLFEDGHLTDSQGRRVSFKNALIVMTSNVGSSAIAKGRKNSIGFIVNEDVSTSYDGMKSLLMEELKHYFLPELLNRIDEVVVFRPLEKSQMLQILEKMISEVKKRLFSSYEIGLEISESAMNFICEEGYDKSYGARPLRRAITLIVEDLVSESILSENYEPGDIAILDMDESGDPMVNKKPRHTSVMCSIMATQEGQIM